MSWSNDCQIMCIKLVYQNINLVRLSFKDVENCLLRHHFSASSHICLPSSIDSRMHKKIGLKKKGWWGFSEGWQGCSEGFPIGDALGKFLIHIHPLFISTHNSYSPPRPIHINPLFLFTDNSCLPIVLFNP